MDARARNSVSREKKRPKRSSAYTRQTNKQHRTECCACVLVSECECVRLGMSAQHMRQHKNPTDSISTARAAAAAHIYVQLTGFSFMRKEYVRNEHCRDMQNELTGKWQQHLCPFLALVLRSLSVSLSLAFHQQNDSFSVCWKTNTRINHHATYNHTQLTTFETFQTHSTYLRIRRWFFTQTLFTITNEYRRDVR